MASEVAGHDSQAEQATRHTGYTHAVAPYLLVRIERDENSSDVGVDLILLEALAKIVHWTHTQGNERARIDSEHRSAERSR